MPSPNKVVTVALALAIAAVVFVPLSTIVTQAAGAQTVDNETFTAQTDEWQDLEGWNIDESTVTVEWYNSTSDSWETLTEGTDYELRPEPGQIQTLSSGTVSDGDDVRASYEYSTTSAIEATVITLVTTLLAVLMLVVAAKPVMEGV